VSTVTVTHRRVGIYPKEASHAPQFATQPSHALCGAHVLRELVAVTETGTDLDRAWAQQTIDALLALDEAAEAARAAGKDASDGETRNKHELVPPGRGHRDRPQRTYLITRWHASPNPRQVGLLVGVAA
jgi:hypothetical protein